MPTRRQQRLNDLLFQEISLLVPGQMDDPRLEGVVVTRVEVTQDMSTAKVYVTVSGADEAAVAPMLAALAHAEGRLRVELGDLGLRRLPHLVFARDKVYESGERVLAILDDLHVEPEVDADPPPTAGEPPGGVPVAGDDRPGSTPDG